MRANLPRVFHILCLLLGAVLLPWLGMDAAVPWYYNEGPLAVRRFFGENGILVVAGILAIAGMAAGRLLAAAGAALWRRGQAFLAAGGPRARHQAKAGVTFLGLAGLIALGVTGSGILKTWPSGLIYDRNRIELIRRQAGRFDEAILARTSGQSSPPPRMEAADSAYTAGRYGEAAEAYRAAYAARFRQALEGPPPADGRPLEHYARAYAQLMAGDLTAVEAWTQEAMRRDSTRSAPFYLQGHVERQRGFHRSAATRFERAWERERGSIGSALSWATTLVLLEELPGARVAFYHALGSDFYATAIADYLGLLEALEVLGRRATANPTDVTAQVVRAMALRYLLIYDPARVPDAESAAQAALQGHPENPDALVTLGVLARKREDLPAAERFFRRAVTADPRHAYAWWMLGVIFWRQGRLEDALRAYRTAGGLDPTQPTYQQVEADILWRLERYREAVAPAERAVNLDPRHADAWLVLGRVYQALDRDPEALAAFVRGLRLDPGSPYLLYGVGAQLQRAERYEEAVPYYEAAIARGVNSHWAFFHLGNVLLWLGRLSDAARVLEDGVLRFPDNADLHKSLGNAYEAMGRMADADRVRARGAALEKPRRDR